MRYFIVTLQHNGRSYDGNYYSSTSYMDIILKQKAYPNKKTLQKYYAGYNIINIIETTKEDLKEYERT